jgi:hypothetical protein
VVNDTLPTVLIEFGDGLERAIARELSIGEPTPLPRERRSRRRRRTMVGVAAGCAALAGAVAAVAVVVSGGGSDSSGFNRQVLRAAAIALPTPSPNTILHVSVTQTTSPGARGDSAHLVPTLDAEGWFQQGPPYRSVTREQVPGQPPIWQNDSRVYDPATKRAYTLPLLPSRPRFTLTNGPDSMDTLQVATAYGPVRETVSKAQARALRAGTDEILLIGSWNGHTFSVSASVTPKTQATGSSVSAPTSTSLTFPARLHRLLQSGNARVAGRVTVDGRAAIKIAISGVSGYQRLIYYVDPMTYRPVELDSYGFSDADVTRLVFHVYQQLATKGNARLLRLHTAVGTTVDDNPAGFYQHLPPLLFW